MNSLVKVAVHSSQFPEQVRRELLESLRRRQINHKFLYDSIKQAQKWLKLHETFSPARTDPDCQATYERSFEAVAARLSASIQVVGLGCGGGQKDARLLALLTEKGTSVSYVPLDASVPLVLAAQQATKSIVPAMNCYPLVSDLATADDLTAVLERDLPEGERLYTFFGMIPNFEPDLVMPRLRSLVRPQDWLVFSANLAPGDDYDGGMQKILPLYDNALTQDWLITFLLDLGVERSDGEVAFSIENGRAGLKRIAAAFQFRSHRTIELDQHRFEFGPGDALRLFFSYRYTGDLTHSLLAQYGFEVADQWITKSQEEGVFLCRQR